MSEEATKPTRWNVPSIDGGDGNGFPTAGRLEALQKEAYDEAWQKGHADGLAAGEKDARERLGRLNELLKALAHPFDDLDEMIEKQLVELAMAVVKQLFRREMRMDPTHVIGVVREAIQLLPAASRNVQLHLHPDDAALVREALSPSEGDLAWTIIEDPLISRGGCNVTTDNSRIDATNESRLQAAIAAIAGDERS